MQPQSTGGCAKCHVCHSACAHEWCGFLLTLLFHVLARYIFNVAFACGDACADNGGPDLMFAYTPVTASTQLSGTTGGLPGSTIDLIVIAVRAVCLRVESPLACCSDREVLMTAISRILVCGPQSVVVVVVGMIFTARKFLQGRRRTLSWAELPEEGTSSVHPMHLEMGGGVVSSARKPEEDDPSAGWRGAAHATAGAPLQHSLLD